MAKRTTHPFRGRFEIKVDPKGRLSLPSVYRDATSSQLIITNHRYQNRSCLHVYTLPEWEQLERRIARLSPLKAEVQAFSRFYLAGGQAVDVDAQGRILIPQSLRRYAGLDLNVVLVGLSDKFEIWAQDSWDAIYQNLSENFEATLAAVADLDDGQGPREVEES